LLDVSPVAQPAYPDATSELKKRDLETETKEETETAAAETVASESAESATEDFNHYLYKSKILNF
jgi:phage head maturation protease